MTVIKPEMMSRKVTKYDLLPLSFLKKSPYTGSKGRMRYRIEKTEVEESAPADGLQGEEKPEPTFKTLLRVSVWHGPFAYDCTPPEEMRIADFAFSENGLEEITAFLNMCMK